jgi:hypothetical protein
MQQALGEAEHLRAIREQGEQRMEDLSKETYIGDGVYASFDGHQIWLRTGDGNNQRIALESETFANLLAYKKRLLERIAEAATGGSKT